MAWYWPKIEDEATAEAAAKPAVGVSCLVACVSGLIAILSILYHRSIFGFNGWSLVDAAIFAIVAWRISKMSRSWAIVGLALYLLEVTVNFVNNPSPILVVIAIAFILMYIGGIRGAFAHHRYKKAGFSEAQSGPPIPPAPSP